MSYFSENVNRSFLRKLNTSEASMLKSSILYLNEFDWVLDWQKEDSQWNIFLEKSLILSVKSESELQSIVYGMFYVAYNLKALDISFIHESSNQIQSPILEKINILRDIFQRLTKLNEQILLTEIKLSAIGRARLIYKSYLEGVVNHKLTKLYKEFAEVYERKLALEKSLQELSKVNVEIFKKLVRGWKFINADLLDLVPTTISFVFLELEKKNSHWYLYKTKWLYYEGDQLIFVAENDKDFAGFVLGMAFFYASLSDDILEQIKSFR